MKAKTKFDDFVVMHTGDEFLEYYSAHSKEDTMKYFNLGSYIFNNIMCYWEIKKDKDDILKLRNETNMKKYGVSNQFQRVEYIKNSCINKYGSLEIRWAVGAQHAKENAQRQGYNSMSQTPEVIEKRKNTCMKKYGYAYVTSSPEIVEKTRLTKLERYNDSTYHNIEKMKATNMDRYGVTYNFSSADPALNDKGTQRKIQQETGIWNNRDKAKQTCLDRFGEDFFIKQTEKMLLGTSKGSMSNPNKLFAAYLTELGFMFEQEFRLNNYIYDFKLGNYLIEIDPYSTHNTTWGLFRNPKDIMYHRNKTLNAIDANYKCIHVFDWTNIDEILWGILNHKIEFIDIGEPHKHIFNIKKKQLVNTLTEDCVEIFDDGFKIEIGE